MKHLYCDGLTAYRRYKGQRVLFAHYERAFDSVRSEVL
jgi:hypothetical protein